MESRGGRANNSRLTAEYAMVRGGGRRRPKDSMNPPPRDSDASFASSRPSSSVGISRSSAANVEIYKERAVQLSAVATVNSSLRELSHSFNITFRPFSPPSLKDLTETITLLLQCIDCEPTKLEDDLPIVLKSLNYPFKINKSILKTPPAPHQWHTILALLHWLVQIAVYTNKLENDSESFLENNDVNAYALQSFLHYMHGDDDSVDALDQEFSARMEKERDNAAESLKVWEQNVAELEKKAESLRLAPSQIEVLEKEKSLLEEDVKKFHTMISGFTEKIEDMKKVLEGKDKELETKLEERKRICEENEELKARVESQTFNPRDVERMRRELQVVERDIVEAEVSRNAWEEKTWDLDATIGHKFKELETQAMECNQAMRRLKLDNSFQFAVNAKGSTVAEVVGLDYKITLKPMLASLLEDSKKYSMQKLEELISLKQRSSDNAVKIESKRNLIAALQSHVDEMENQMKLLKKQTQEYTSRCVTEAKLMLDDVQSEAQNLDTMEKEAQQILKNSQLKLEEVIKQGEEETQVRAYELLALIDSVSKYKEFMSSKISEMKADLSETVTFISDTHKNSLKEVSKFM